MLTDTPSTRSFEESIARVKALFESTFSLPLGTRQSEADYWESLASVSRQVISDEPGDIHHGEDLLLQLFAATPDLDYKQFLYNHHHTFIPEDEYDRDKAAFSHYNHLVRAVALNFPDARASELVEALVTIAHDSLSDPVLKSYATEAVTAVVRGAQHELCFAQLLTYTAWVPEHSTENQDVHGYDFAVVARDGRSARIDVKASFYDIVAETGYREAYTVTRDGILIVHSFVTDEELDDHFYVPDSLAQERARDLEALLDEAVR